MGLALSSLNNTINNNTLKMPALLSTTIFSKSRPHTLRALSVASFPPGFLFLLIHGIAFDRVNPAIGILPLFFSSLFSAFLLANEKRCGCNYSGLSGTAIHLVADLLLGIGLLACLILTWIFISNNDCYRSSGAVLATYATNFMLLNFSVHLYFVLSQLWDAIQPGDAYPSSCPRCRSGTYKFNFGGFTISKMQGLREGYAPLLDGENAANDEREEERGTGEEAV